MQDFGQERSVLSLPCRPVAGTVGRGDSGTRPEVEEMGGRVGQKCRRKECGGEGEEERTTPGFWFVTETMVPILSH